MWLHSQPRPLPPRAARARARLRRHRRRRRPPPRPPARGHSSPAPWARAAAAARPGTPRSSSRACGSARAEPRVSLWARASMRAARSQQADGHSRHHASQHSLRASQKPLRNGGLPRCKANVSGKGAGLQRMGLGFICGAQSRQGSNWLHAAPCTRCMRGRGGCSPGSRSSCAAAPPRWRSARTRPPPGARRPVLLRLRQSPRVLGAETKWLHLHTAHSSWRTAGVTADLHQRAARHASPCIWPWAGQ